MTNASPITPLVDMAERLTTIKNVLGEEQWVTIRSTFEAHLQVLARLTNQLGHLQAAVKSLETRMTRLEQTTKWELPETDDWVAVPTEDPESKAGL